MRPQVALGLLFRGSNVAGGRATTYCMGLTVPEGIALGNSPKVVRRSFRARDSPTVDGYRPVVLAVPCPGDVRSIGEMAYGSAPAAAGSPEPTAAPLSGRYRKRDARSTGPTGVHTGHRRHEASVTPPNQSCRGCHQAGLDAILDLGVQPHAASFPTADELVDAPAWPLVLARCRSCGLFQLAGEAPPESDIVGTPAPTASATIARHAEGLVEEVIATGLVRAGGRVVDLASHGGHLAPFLARRGIEATVVEAVPWRVEELRAAGHHVVAADPEAPGFDWSAVMGAELVVDFFRLAHLANLDAGLAAIAAMLGPGGAAVVEFDYALTTIAETQFDAIRHGHFSYLTLHAIEPIVARHGLVVADATRHPVYGGTLRLVLRQGRNAMGSANVDGIRAAERDAGLSDRARLAAFADSVTARCEALQSHLSDARKLGRSVVGYGAPTRASTLLNAAGVTTREIAYTVDRAASKQGRHLPGSGILIRSPDFLRASPPDEVLILTWDIAAEVAAQLDDLPSETRFVVPLPELADVGRPGVQD